MSSSYVLWTLSVKNRDTKSVFCNIRGDQRNAYIYSFHLLFLHSDHFVPHFLVHFSTPIILLTGSRIYKTNPGTTFFSLDVNFEPYMMKNELFIILEGTKNGRVIRFLGVFSHADDCVFFSIVKNYKFVCTNVFFNRCQNP